MKKIRKIAQNPLFNLLIIISFLLSSCSNSDDFQLNEHKFNKYSGKELFAAVFFSNGEFAKNINSYSSNVDGINQMTSKQKIEFTRNIDTLINEIEKNSPTFFDNFKRNILSKNHQLIENAIIEGGEKMYENLQNIYPNIDKLYDKVESDYLDGKIVSEDAELDRKKLENKKDEYAEILNKNMISTNQEVAEAPCSWAVVCVAYFVLAVHNTAAITVNVAAVAVAVVAVAVKVKVGKAVPEFDTASKSKNKDLLEFEILVNEIAEL